MADTTANTANVSAGKPKVAGAVYVAATTATLPEDATTALASTFKSLGYVSDAGVVNANSPETDTIKAWGGDTVLTPILGKKDRFTFTLIEALNADVLTLVYGDANVTGALASGLTVTANAQDGGAHAFVIEMIMTGNTVKRIVIPNGTVAEIGDITYVDGEPIGYELTVNAAPDEDGNTHYEYLKTVTTTGTGG